VLHPRGLGGPLRQAFEQELRELGYVDGQNIAIEYRSEEGRDERLPLLAAELARLNVDVLVVGLTQRALGKPLPGAELALTSPGRRRRLVDLIPRAAHRCRS